MQTRIAKLIRAAAIVILVLGGVVGVQMGLATAGDGEGLNIWMMMLYWGLFFIVGMLCYGFAVLADRFARLRDETMQRLAGMSSAAAQTPPAMEANLPQKAVPGLGNAPKPKAGASPQFQPGNIFCPYCGKPQPDGRSSCYWCGATFIR